MLLGRKELAEESLGWIFVDAVPILCEERRVARQAQVETWLDLAQAAKALGIERKNKNKQGISPMSYVV